MEENPSVFALRRVASGESATLVVRAFDSPPGFAMEFKSDSPSADDMKQELLEQAATAFGDAWHLTTWVTWREPAPPSSSSEDGEGEVEVGPRDAVFADIESRVMQQQPGREFEESMGLMLCRASRQSSMSSSSSADEDADVWEFEFVV